MSRGGEPVKRRMERGAISLLPGAVGGGGRDCARQYSWYESIKKKSMW